jgi:hypothetical protein
MVDNPAAMTSQPSTASPPGPAHRRQRLIWQGLSLAAIGLVLAACRSSQPLPGASATAVWQKQFKALDCSNPRYDFELQSSEPLMAAMITVCHRMPVKRQTSGWQTLVTIDAQSERVQAVPITSIYSGGLHFTKDGDVIWYSSGTLGEATRTQKHVEAYALRKGESRERLLGRIQVPFLVGPGIGHIQGEGCHLVSFHSYLANDKSPRLQQLFLVNDGEPFESARPLEGIGRGLYWDPLRKQFVVQKDPYRILGMPGRVELGRHALDCSGQQHELDIELSRRLALITDENAQYRMSPQGDLSIGLQKADGQEQEIIVFHGDQVHRIAALQSFALCPDLGCEPYYDPLFAGPWSASGQYFMVDRGFDRVEIYRLADMQVVKRWVMKNGGNFPVHGFFGDRAAYQFDDHSRLTFQTW